MQGIVVELTNHCNLNCKHCSDRRHSADGFLDPGLFSIIAQNARKYGCRHISLTGGEPTLHPEFKEILETALENGYTVGFVTNGWNFVDIYKQLPDMLPEVAIITFSIDGARESTHDSLRQRGSFRRIMQAVSICTLKDIPFSFNSVITAKNHVEIESLVVLAAKLGGRDIRFGYLMPTKRSLDENLVMDHGQLKTIQAKIIKIQDRHDMPVILAPGFYTQNLFPCSPLEQTEFNIDWQGNVTLCCNLSGYGNLLSTKDVVGNLKKLGFHEACDKIKQLVAQLHQYKTEHHDGKSFKDADFFPCLYCLNYFEKIIGSKFASGTID